MQHCFFISLALIIIGNGCTAKGTEKAQNGSVSDVIKENDDDPKGWKVVSRAPNESQLLIHSKGAVPDFLQELREEEHGPEFDYIASFDNRNEKADESDYHYKTPYDTNDFLSHFQKTDDVEMSKSDGWSVKKNALSQVKKDETKVDTVRKRTDTNTAKNNDKAQQLKEILGDLITPLKEMSSRLGGNNGKSNSPYEKKDMNEIDAQISQIINLMADLPDTPDNGTSSKEEDDDLKAESEVHRRVKTEATVPNSKVVPTSNPLPAKSTEKEKLSWVIPNAVDYTQATNEEKLLKILDPSIVQRDTMAQEEPDSSDDEQEEESSDLENIPVKISKEDDEKSTKDREKKVVIDDAGHEKQEKPVKIVVKKGKAKAVPMNQKVTKTALAVDTNGNKKKPVKILVKPTKQKTVGIEKNDEETEDDLQEPEEDAGEDMSTDQEEEEENATPKPEPIKLVVNKKTTTAVQAPKKAPQLTKPIAVQIGDDEVAVPTTVKPKETTKEIIIDTNNTKPSGNTQKPTPLKIILKSNDTKPNEKNPNSAAVKNNPPVKLIVKNGGEQNPGSPPEAKVQPTTTSQAATQAPIEIVVGGNTTKVVPPEGNKPSPPMKVGVPEQAATQAPIEIKVGGKTTKVVPPGGNTTNPVNTGAQGQAATQAPVQIMVGGTPTKAVPSEGNKTNPVKISVPGQATQKPSGQVGGGSNQTIKLQINLPGTTAKPAANKLAPQIATVEPFSKNDKPGIQLNITLNGNNTQQKPPQGKPGSSNQVSVSVSEGNKTTSKPSNITNPKQPSAQNTSANIVINLNKPESGQENIQKQPNKTKPVHENKDEQPNKPDINQTQPNKTKTVQENKDKPTNTSTPAVNQKQQNKTELKPKPDVKRKQPNKTQPQQGNKPKPGNKLEVTVNGTKTSIQIAKPANQSAENVSSEVLNIESANPGAPLDAIVKSLVSSVQKILKIKTGTTAPVKGSWALAYQVNSTKPAGEKNNSVLQFANNMILKFNNTNDDQEDWSLVFHRGRADDDEAVTGSQNQTKSIVNTKKSTNSTVDNISGLLANSSASDSDVRTPIKRTLDDGIQRSLPDEVKTKLPEEGWSVFDLRSSRDSGTDPKGANPGEPVLMPLSVDADVNNQTHNSKTELKIKAQNDNAETIKTQNQNNNAKLLKTEQGMVLDASENQQVQNTQAEMMVKAQKENDKPLKTAQGDSIIYLSNGWLQFQPSPDNSTNDNGTEDQSELNNVVTVSLSNAAQIQPSQSVKNKAEEKGIQSKTEGKSSQFNTEGKSSQSKTEGKSSQSKTEGKSSPSKTEGKSSPSKTEGKSSQSKTEGKSSPSKTEGKSGPSKTEGIGKSKPVSTISLSNGSMDATTNVPDGDKNKKLLADSNDDEGTVNMLEDDKDEIDRDLKKGVAVNVNKTNSKTGNVSSLLDEKSKTNGTSAAQNDTGRVQKVMDTIRKAGLDVPENSKRPKEYSGGSKWNSKVSKNKKNSKLKDKKKSSSGSNKKQLPIGKPTVKVENKLKAKGKKKPTLKGEMKLESKKKIMQKKLKSGGKEEQSGSEKKPKSEKKVKQMIKTIKSGDKKKQMKKKLKSGDTKKEMKNELKSDEKKLKKIKQMTKKLKSGSKKKQMKKKLKSGDTEKEMKNQLKSDEKKLKKINQMTKKLKSGSKKKQMQKKLKAVGKKKEMKNQLKSGEKKLKSKKKIEQMTKKLKSGSKKKQMQKKLKSGDKKKEMKKKLNSKKKIKQMIKKLKSEGKKNPKSKKKIKQMIKKLKSGAKGKPTLGGKKKLKTSDKKKPTTKGAKNPISKGEGKPKSKDAKLPASGTTKKPKIKLKSKKWKKKAKLLSPKGKRKLEKKLLPKLSKLAEENDKAKADNEKEKKEKAKEQEKEKVTSGPIDKGEECDKCRLGNVTEEVAQKAEQDLKAGNNSVTKLEPVTQLQQNTNVSEERLQASLHETLQSAMSGIVQVFNNHVDGHAIVAAKGSLKENAVNGTSEGDGQVENQQAVDTNVTWTPWSMWGSCSVSCGRGWITRRRFCLTVTRKCEGRAIEMKFCHEKACPEEIVKTTEAVGALLNPQGEWAQWSPCSVTCGEGWTVRRKICYGRHLDRCSGPVVDIKRCRKHRRCISATRTKEKIQAQKARPKGDQVSWSEWSECSTTCGRGWQMRTRDCNISNLHMCTKGRFDVKNCSKGKCPKKSKGHKHHLRHKYDVDERGSREAGSNLEDDESDERIRKPSKQRKKKKFPKKKKRKLLGEKNGPQRASYLFPKKKKPKTAPGKKQKPPKKNKAKEKLKKFFGKLKIKKKKRKKKKKKPNKLGEKIKKNLQKLKLKRKKTKKADTWEINKNGKLEKESASEPSVAKKERPIVTPPIASNITTPKVPISNPISEARKVKPTTTKGNGTTTEVSEKNPLKTNATKFSDTIKVDEDEDTPTASSNETRNTTRNETASNKISEAPNKPTIGPKESDDQKKNPTVVQNDTSQLKTDESPSKLLNQTHENLFNLPIKLNDITPDIGNFAEFIEQIENPKFAKDLAGDSSLKPTEASPAKAKVSTVIKQPVPTKVPLESLVGKNISEVLKPANLTKTSPEEPTNASNVSWVLGGKKPSSGNVTFSNTTNSWALKKPEKEKEKEIKNGTPVSRNAWSSWGDWSPCTKTCGTGIQTRTRKCMPKRHRRRFVRSHDGCPGKSFETKRCEQDPCDPYDNAGISIPEGYQVKLRCPYKKNKGVKKVYWVTPHGKTISELSLDLRYLVRGSVLYIRHSRKSDVGVYHCLAATKDDIVVETLSAKLVVQTCKDNICQNGGQCFEITASKHHPYDRITCRCAEGFAGQFCTQNLLNLAEKEGAEQQKTKFVPIFTKDRKLLVIFVVLIFSMLAGMLLLILCFCQSMAKSKKDSSSDDKPKPSGVNESYRMKKIGKYERPDGGHPDGDQIYAEIDPLTKDHSAQSMHPSPTASLSHSVASSHVSAAIEHTGTPRSRASSPASSIRSFFERGVKKLQERIQAGTKRSTPPSKAEIEAAERASRAQSMGYRPGTSSYVQRRTLPPTPEYQSDHPYFSDYYSDAEPWVRPAQHPIELNTDVQRGIRDQRIHQFPMSGTGRLSHTSSASHQLTGTQMTQTPSMRTPDLLPSDPAAASYHQRPTSAGITYHPQNYVVPAPPTQPISHPPSQMSQFQPSSYQPSQPVSSQHPSQNMSYKPLNNFMPIHDSPSKQAAYSAPSTGALTPNRSLGDAFTGLVRPRPGTSASPFAHTGRVSPPIRARIAALEAALGVSESQAAANRAEVRFQPQEKTYELAPNASLGDCFTGLNVRPRAQVPEAYALQRQKDQVIQGILNTNQSVGTNLNPSGSLGDAFTGLRGSGPPPPVDQRQGRTVHMAHQITSNRSLGDCFTGLNENFRNTNASAVEKAESDSSLRQGQRPAEVSSVTDTPEFKAIKTHFENTSQNARKSATSLESSKNLSQNANDYLSRPKPTIKRLSAQQDTSGGRNDQNVDNLHEDDNRDCPNFVQNEITGVRVLSENVLNDISDANSTVEEGDLIPSSTDMSKNIPSPSEEKTNLTELLDMLKLSDDSKDSSDPETDREVSSSSVTNITKDPNVRQPTSDEDKSILSNSTVETIISKDIVPGVINDVAETLEKCGGENSQSDDEVEV